jgi:serine/threonine protein kinase
LLALNSKRPALSRADVVRGPDLGSGNFGVVYRGTWHGAAVAVKELRGVDDDERAARQLRSESEQLAKLPPHPNVVLFYGILESPLSIVLEFCAGGALDELLYGKRKRDFPSEQLVAIGRDVALGLAHLHAERVVHRDVAARNVLLDETLTKAKLSDFGMSRGGVGYRVQNATQDAMGPIRWMAPEQLRDRAVSHASDAYAFGCFLHECFGRAEPWDGWSNVEVAKRVMEGDHPPVLDSYPAVVQATMQRCLQWAARIRPKMREVAEEFDEALRLGRE